jgi:hypothetical protein
VDVVLKVSLPKTLSPGSSFLIYACVEVSNPSTADVTLPVAGIKAKSLKWHQQVRYRALLASGRSLMEENEDYCLSSVTLNTLPESQWVDPRECNAGDKGIVQSGIKSWYFPATFEARIPSDTGLSLRTRNIDCTYIMELKLKADISGKEFEQKVEAEVLVVPSAF